MSAYDDSLEAALGRFDAARFGLFAYEDASALTALEIAAHHVMDVAHEMAVEMHAAEPRYTQAEVIEWLRSDMHALSDRAAAYLLTLPVGSRSLKVSADPDQWSGNGHLDGEEPHE